MLQKIEAKKENLREKKIFESVGNHSNQTYITALLDQDNSPVDVLIHTALSHETVVCEESNTLQLAVTSGSKK